MDKMKDIKKFMDMFRPDKMSDQALLLPYESTTTYNTISLMRELCTELKRIGSFGLVTYSIVEDEKKSKKKSLQYLATLFNDTHAKFGVSDPSRAPLQACFHTLNSELNLASGMRDNLRSGLLHQLTAVENRCADVQEGYKRLALLQKELCGMREKLPRLETADDDIKLSQLKENIEELANTIESESDVYLQKILQFEATNFQNAELLQELLLVRSEYHEKCHQAYKNMIPECKRQMEEHRKPVSFGTPLETHLRETKRIIAYPIEFCVSQLSNIDDLRQEGLFRVSGSKNKADLLCEVLNVMKTQDMQYSWHPNVVADALKRYLRQMPIQLLGKVPISEWEKCYELHASGQVQEALWKMQRLLLESMPPSYYQNTEFLIRFLVRVVAERSNNLMGVTNICTVFVPNLFRSDNSNNVTSSMSMDNNTCLKFILETILNEADFFFPHSNEKVSVKERKKQLESKSCHKTETSKFKNTDMDKNHNVISRAERCKAVYGSQKLSDEPPTLNRSNSNSSGGAPLSSSMPEPTNEPSIESRSPPSIPSDASVLRRLPPQKPPPPLPSQTQNLSPIDSPPAAPPRRARNNPQDV